MKQRDASSDRRRAWGLGCGTLLLPVLALVYLAWAGPESLRSTAIILLALVALIGYYSVVLTAVVRLAGLGSGLLAKQELLLRAWVARFAKDPEGLWIHWAEQVSNTEVGLECLERAAPLGARGSFELGLAYLEGPVRERAIPCFRAAAEKGHAGAMLRLSECLRWEFEGARDSEAAQRWQARAESMGGAAPRSSSVLRGREEAAGRALAKAEDLLDVLWSKPWMPWLCLAGFALLLPTIGLYLAVATLFFAPFLWLAMRFTIGPGGRLNAGTRRLVERAEAGDTRSAVELARFYLTGGHGLPRDPLSAQLWFRRAAEAADAEAMAALAEMLESGHGCLRDPRQARSWYEAAARLGHDRARVWVDQHQDPGS